MESELLFVYGTLKRGRGNHHLLRDAEFVQLDSVRGELWTGGVPFLVSPANGGSLSKVYGEIYRVTPEQLARCDGLEGHPRAYLRQLLLALQMSAFVHVYTWPHGTAGREHIPSGWF